jgi:CRISPR-associated protein Cas2
MLALFCYDVSTIDPTGPRRLRRVAKFLERYGTRVQRSVFEIRASATSIDFLQVSLLELMDLRCDSLRIYRLPDSAADDITRLGVQQGTEFIGQTFIF